MNLEVKASEESKQLSIFLHGPFVKKRPSIKRFRYKTLTPVTEKGVFSR